jgi:hypothetical protein
MLSAMQKPKRPRDPNELAKTVIGIATGEIEDRPPPDERDPAAVALGSKGGKARAENMSAGRRKQIAKAAAAKRWGKKS